MNEKMPIPNTIFPIGEKNTVLPGFSPVLIEKVSIRYNPFADGRQFLNGVGVFSFMMQPFSCIQV